MAMGGTTELEVGADGVAIVTIVNPPVNAITFDVIESLKGTYEEALRRNDVKAIVLTGKGGIFSGGFDITILGAVQKSKKVLEVDYISINVMTDLLEAAGKPSVAAIAGIAIGAGLEFCMVCQARISTPRAQLSLPELRLGIIPGFGGTQRLPRLIGLRKALEMIMMSKTIRAEEANQLGLVDAIVSPENLLNTARRWALDISESRRPWVRALRQVDKLESREEVREILEFARAQAKKQVSSVKHPLICIDVIEEGLVSGPRAGLQKEAIASQELVLSDTSKSLVHVFFSHRAISQVPGATDLGLMPRSVTKAAVVGCGFVGSRIATALILCHYPVVLKEVNEKQLNAGINRIKANLQSQVKKGNMTEKGYEKALSCLTCVLDYERFKEVDLVIEAVIEDFKLKQQIFAELEQHCPPHCILATSTSTIDLILIGEKTNCQERIVGAYFFGPAHITPLLEIVRSQHTSPQTVVDFLDMGKRIKKTPIVVGNCNGSAVTRMFFPYIQAALLLIDRGLDVYNIDDACAKFGMTVGPFRMANMVGFEVDVASGMQYLKNFPGKAYKSMLVPLMTEGNRTGGSSQKRFYKYDSERKATHDPEIMKYVEKPRSIGGKMSDPELMKLDDKEIVEMVLFPVINEACRVLDEGIAVKASDLDIASIFGMGFPPYRGGIMHWVDCVGATRIHAKLSEWEAKYGQFFRPCSYLSERAVGSVPLNASTKQANARL